MDTTAGSGGAPWTLYLDADGDTLWVSDLNLANEHLPFDMAVTAEGDVIYAGVIAYNWDPMRLDGSLIKFSISGAVSVDPVLPMSLVLEQNFPNPFNPSTVIRYQLLEASEVALTVHDLRGRQVRTLVGVPQPAGSYAVQWDGRDDHGAPLSAGVYLCRLQTKKVIHSMKMVYLK